MQCRIVLQRLSQSQTDEEFACNSLALVFEVDVVY